MTQLPLPWIVAALVWVTSTLSPARPDEGMWPFDSLPLQQLKEKYNFEPSKDWLDHVRLGSVRFDTGGSGSFVSANGLVMTNHHVALETIQKVSTPEKDYVKDGFSAREYGKEIPGKDLTLRQLIAIVDVTADVAPLAADAREAKLKDLCADAKAKECAKRGWKVGFKAGADGKPGKELEDARSARIEADPVALYDGNAFRVHLYHVFDDVRVVWAPEKQVAFFGGDPDNFTYPRYDLDCAFFRVYEDGKPIDSSKFHFKWNSAGAKSGDLVFVSGHPGSTERLLTHDEMRLHRELWVPAVVRFLGMQRDMMKKRMDADEKAAFALRDQYFGVCNSLKAFEGHLRGLRDDEMMAKMKARDEELVTKSGKPEVKAAFETIAKATEAIAEKYKGKKPNPQALNKAIEEAAAGYAAEKGVINKARFEVYGTANYPDATFTLRLAYGTVKGYEAGTTMVPPKTTINGLYERNAAFDNQHPFDLPKRWIDAKTKLNLDTPYNFVCTADIIGGNSGSPILNREAEVVGLVFDGNIESLPGNYWFDERVNRCVGVHTAGMIEAMDKVYGEKDLAKELRGK